PMGNGTGGSRSLVVGGSAIMGAAIKVQTQARRLAAHMLEAAFDDVVLTDGRYQVKGVPDKALMLEAIAARAYGEGLPDGIESGLEATEFFRPPQLVYPFGAHVAVVEVDRESGRVSVRAFISVDDCGVRVSPTIGATPAMVNAVVDALRPFGVRHLDMPLRPERVWQAMKSGAR